MPASTRSGGRLLLVMLTLWALAMVVPDLYRLFQPLGSFGFNADNDGLVTDVQGPFAAEADSPAWKAGLRPGDRLDLAGMRCIPLHSLRCATALATFGGVRLVGDHRRAELVVAESAGRPARTLAIAAETRPFSWWVVAVLLLDQVAAILVILAAAWLVWTRPGGMTWGFFLYVIWFNPGQSDAYYAFLQHSPTALLAQSLAGALAQGVGLAGFLLFALRVPQDASAPRWQALEKRLPVLALLFGLLLAAGYANLLGYPTELLTRAGILCGLLVAAGAFAILLARRRELSPSDFQRLRWVIWGCLIGLPALVLADIGQGTTLLDDIWGHAPLPEEAWGLVRLVNGVLCLFVFEAVRRPRVVSVAIPLRRVTILGLLLSVPTLILHEQIGHMGEGVRESLNLPSWAWIAIAAVALFIISKLHEHAVHLADRHFNRAVGEAGRKLGEAILEARDLATLESHLATGVRQMLDLVSAGVFREAGGGFRLGAHEGSDGTWTRTLQPDEPLLKAALTRPFDIRADAAARGLFPDGPARPVLAVPVADRCRCYAVALYGAHVSGNDLNHDERAMLAELASLAASVFVKLEHEGLQRRIAALEQELEAASAKPAPGKSTSAEPGVASGRP